MPAIDQLKPLERRIFELIQEAGGEWVTRGRISQLLERPGRVQPGDTAALEKLTLLGLIEAREGRRGAVATRLEYRVKAEE
jgi:hypothetical protein